MQNLTPETVDKSNQQNIKRYLSIRNSSARNFFSTHTLTIVPDVSSSLYHRSATCSLFHPQHTLSFFVVLSFQNSFLLTKFPYRCNLYSDILTRSSGPVSQGTYKHTYVVHTTHIIICILAGVRVFSYTVCIQHKFQGFPVLDCSASQLLRNRH